MTCHIYIILRVQNSKEEVSAVAIRLLIHSAKSISCEIVSCEWHRSGSSHSSGLWRHQPSDTSPTTDSCSGSCLLWRCDENLTSNVLCTHICIAICQYMLPGVLGGVQPFHSPSVLRTLQSLWRISLPSCRVCGLKLAPTFRGRG